MEYFKLLKSLTRGEKRYFQLLNSRYRLENKSNAMQLFDVYSEMDEFDKEKLSKLLDDSKIMNNLAFENHRLGKLLIQSLVFYTSGISKLKEDNLDLYRYCEVLYQKGLYEACYTNIKKGISLAKKKESFSVAILFLNLKRYLLNQLYNIRGINNFHDEMVSVNEEVNQLIEKEQLVNQVNQISTNLYLLLLKRTGLNNSQNLKSTLKQYETQLLNLGFDFQSDREYIAYYSAWNYYYLIKGNIEKCLETLELIEKKYIDSNKDYYSFEHYLKTRFNIISILGNLGESELQKKNLEIFSKMKIPQNYKSLKTLHENLYLSIKVTSLYSFGKKEEVVSLKNRIDKSIIPHIGKSNISTQYVTIFIFTHSLFDLKEYNKADHYCKIILEEFDKHLLQNYRAAILFLRLIIQYELGNYLLIKSFADAAYWYLKSNNLYDEIDKMILNWCKTNLSRANPEKLIARSKQLTQKIEKQFGAKYMDHPYKKLYFFGLKEWLLNKQSEAI